MYKCRIQYVEQYKLCSKMGIESHQVRQPSLVDSFYVEHHDVSRDSIGGSTAIVNPLRMLLNQERLNKLGAPAVEMWLKSMRDSGNSNVQQILKKCTDEDLLQMIKPQCIQAPCELEQYLQALNERADLFNSEVARIVAERQEQENAKVVENAESMVESQIK